MRNDLDVIVHVSILFWQSRDQIKVKTISQEKKEWRGTHVMSSFVIKSMNGLQRGAILCVPDSESG